MSVSSLGSPRGSLVPSSPRKPPGSTLSCDSNPGFGTVCSSPMAQKQMEALHRLSQLVTWQEKQRATLFQQQQQEIEELQNVEYISPGVPKHQYYRNPAVGQTTLSVDEPTTEELDSETVPPVNELPFPHHRHGCSPDTTSPVHPVSRWRQGPDERPIRRGVDEEKITSFEEMLETSLHVSQEPEEQAEGSKKTKRPFLRRGEGIARFGMKNTRAKLIKKKKTPSSKCKDHSKGQVVQSQGSRASAGVSLCRPAGGIFASGRSMAVAEGGATRHDSNCPGVAVNKPVVRKLVRMSKDFSDVEDERENAFVNKREVVPRESTPIMFHCSSQDSFMVRKDARLEMEHEELLEFEMMEKAAENSFFSQFSLSQSSVLSTLPSRVQQQQQEQQWRQPDQQLKQLNQLWKSQQEQQHKQPEQRFKQPDQQPKQQLKQPRQQWKQSKQLQLQQREPGQQKQQENGSTAESDTDLDDTLKGSPSLAKGVEFDDNEAWESISQEPPNFQLSRSHSQGSASSVTSSDGIFQSSSSPRHYGIPKALELEPESLTNHACHQHLVEEPVTKESSSLPPPPPTSALVAKLFPALRKVEDKKPPPSHLPESQENIVKAPSPVSSSGGDSGFSGGCDGSRLNAAIPPMSVGISEELRQKLGQLEMEIERYRKENHNLETLRKEREQSLIHLKNEISEFTRQKEEEVAKFEEYKNEELKKIRKEKRVFETYKVEALAARNKKEKEDIEILRRELHDAQEELKVREARWGSTLARYRVKIESLEAENKELQSDLRMMEEERLQVWQMQIDQENKENARAKKVSQSEKRQSIVVANSSPSKCGARPPLGETNQATTLQPAGPPPDRHSSADRDPKQNVSSAAPPLRLGNGKLSVDNQDLTSQQKSAVSSENKLSLGGGITARMHSPAKTRARCPLQDCDLNVPSQQKEAGTKTEVDQPDGSKVITFSNGTRKVISSDKRSSSVYFFNGDVKHMKSDQTVVYYYSEFKITQTNYTDGLEVIEFPNGQSERHFPDGTKEIHFPNDTVKFLYSGGEEKCVFPDGMEQRHYPNGDVVLHMPDGIKEFYSTKFKRREYPDGTMKTVYPDGKQETRYASGRIRVKDKNGKILMDSNSI